MHSTTHPSTAIFRTQNHLSPNPLRNNQLPTSPSRRRLHPRLQQRQLTRHSRSLPTASRHPSRYTTNCRDCVNSSNSLQRILSNLIFKINIEFRRTRQSTHEAGFTLQQPASMPRCFAPNSQPPVARACEKSQTSQCKPHRPTAPLQPTTPTRHRPTRSKSPVLPYPSPTTATVSSSSELPIFAIVTNLSAVTMTQKWNHSFFYCSFGYISAPSGCLCHSVRLSPPQRIAVS
jgi:hypothetical protein